MQLYARLDDARKGEVLSLLGVDEDEMRCGAWRLEAIINGFEAHEVA